MPKPRKKPPDRKKHQHKPHADNSRKNQSPTYKTPINQGKKQQKTTRPQKAWRRKFLLSGLGLCLLGLVPLTPIFASVIGTVLGLIGDYYGMQSHAPPMVYVLLGGGLTGDGQGGSKLNAYSEKRTEALAQAWQQNPLPIILSGVESPWLAQHLNFLHKYRIDKSKAWLVLSENASMNTCENARFSQKLIAYEGSIGTLPDTVHIYLVSDLYHMARARRQFALAGLASTPVIAPMPTPLAWNDPKSNLNHTRRAIYESIALARDLWRPQSQNRCRLASSVSISMIKTPRHTSTKVSNTNFS